MQKYILSLSFILGINTTLLAANTETIEVDWNCKAINYEGEVIKLPDRARVKAQIKMKDDGRFDIKFKDNIFKKSLEKQVTGFVTGLFGGGSDPTHAIDYSECLASFKDDFKNSLEERYPSLCQKANCPSISEINEEFNNELSDQKLIKKSKDLPKVPRYYTGHDETYINDNLYNDLIGYCEGNTEISTEIFTSRTFIEAVAQEVNALNEKVTPECLTKVEVQLKRHNQFTDCSPVNKYPCTKILEANERYSNSNLNFKENQALLLSEKAKEELAKKLEQEKEVLSDSGYRPDATLEQEEQVKAEIESLIQKNIANGNPSYCNANSSIKVNGYWTSIYQFDSVISKNMDYIKENMPRVCLKKFTEAYMAQKYKYKDPAKNELCENHNCNFIKENQNLFKENYISLIQAQFGEEAKEYACNTQPEYETPGSEIVKILGSLEDVNQCNDLKNGEVKVVDNFNTTGVKMRYALKRESSKQLVANVVINFKDGQEGTSVTSEEMLARTQACIDKTSSYFDSPKGENMRVKIMSPDQAASLANNERPAVNDVKIGKAGMRSNSGEYAEDTGCGTITHEVLHLMGLCDEYTESATGYYIDTATGEIANDLSDEQKNSPDYKFKLAYNECRAQSQTPSIMSSHWKAMAQFTGQKSTCECVDGTYCDEVMKMNDNKITDFLTQNPFRIRYDNNSICRSVPLGTTAIYSYDKLKEYTIDPIMETDTQNKVVYKFYSFQMASNNNSSLKGRLSEHRMTCKCEEESCADEMKKFKTISKNDYIKSDATCVYPIMKVKDGTDSGQLVSKDELANMGKGGIKSLGNNTYELTSAPRNTTSSLLHPAHFARIKYGSCKDKVKNYSTCAKFAYKRFKNECPDRPKICDEDESWLLTDE